MILNIDNEWSYFSIFQFGCFGPPWVLPETYSPMKVATAKVAEVEPRRERCVLITARWKASPGEAKYKD